MLEFSNVGAPKEAAVKKQIAVGSSTANLVFYTVPAGKTFRGFATGGINASIKINSVIVSVTSNATGGSLVPMPLELLEGTTVSNGPSTALASIYGVEE